MVWCGVSTERERESEGVRREGGTGGKGKEREREVRKDGCIRGGVLGGGGVWWLVLCSRLHTTPFI